MAIQVNINPRTENQMQEFRPELTDEELEQQREFFNRIKAGPAAIDRQRALLSKLNELQIEEIEEKQREGDSFEIADLGEVKSVGGVDYQVTKKGWKKIGLTKA